jgi:superfamily II DNA or RNA helicase
MFRKGVVDVLVTCRALDEGANIPETQLAIVAAATASQRQRIQRLGRVLRPAVGKSRATVFTLFATEVEKRRLEEEQANLDEFVDISWRSITNA